MGEFVFISSVHEESAIVFFAWIGHNNSVRYSKSCIKTFNQRTKLELDKQLVK